MSAAEIPSEIILDILSRMSFKSLARMRCVSKLWCKYIDNDQYLKILHCRRSTDEPLMAVTAMNDKALPVISVYPTGSKTGSTTPLPKAETIMSLEFNCNCNVRHNRHDILGSCNGLVYLALDWVLRPHFIVVNPLRKEYYILPPTDKRFRRTDYSSPGLGFDDSTNAFKMVSFAITQTKKKKKCAVLHVLGTNSWRQIISRVPINPSLFIKPVFSRGCLCWLAEKGSKMLSLDMRTEVFQLINLPKINGDLVDLNGELGFVYSSYKKHECFEVWVLKEEDWVIHYRFDINPALSALNNRVIGCWNKKGDILINSHYPSERLFIYRLKSGLLEEIAYLRDICNYNDALIYHCSLFAIQGNKFMSCPATTRSQPTVTRYRIPSEST